MMKKNDLRHAVIERVLLCGRTTRPELAELTGIRSATVFEAVERLKGEGLLAEPGREGRRTGRKAPELTFSPEAGQVIGLDFQRTRTLGVVLDYSGRELARVERVAPGPRARLSGCFEEIRAALYYLTHSPDVRMELLRGVGFADPGLVDVRKQHSLRAVNVPGWENVATGEFLRRETSLNTGVWPEELTKTYMEYLLRAPHLPKSLFRLGLDDGIGGGFIKNGELFIGDTGLGMEIGHLVIDRNGPGCQCGNRGCLEAIAGGNGIRRRLGEALADGVRTDLTLANFTLSRFVRSAQTCKAIDVIAHEVSVSVAQALAMVVTLLNPSTIVLGGELSGLGDSLVDTVRRSLQLDCLANSVKSLEIVCSQLDEWGAARGAALLMRKKLLLDEA